jgi:hypothetical protein
MFTKIALSLAVIAGTATVALAQTNKQVGPSVQASSKSSVSAPLYFKYATGAEWWKI